MIDAKSFMKFFEEEMGVEFIDSNTGKRALDVIGEREAKNSKYNDPRYKSDYDRFLEGEGGATKV